MNPSSTMNRGQVLAVWLLCCCGSLCVVTAIQRTELFPYGSSSGDLILAEGDDETSKVLSLPRPLYFYDTAFTQLYVATNGIISAEDLPWEKQYVDDDFPTGFPVVAPFLADIDTSNGHGQIFYRVTETPSVLNRVAQEVHRGFPDARFTPTHAVVATWENVASYDQKKRPSDKVNTFQAVIGYDETDSYVVFLYPQDGLNFFGTQPKHSYNVEIELPARVGFSRGEVAFSLFSQTEGPHYSITSDEQSVKNLYQVGNTGTAGVWLFHTGNRYSFDNIVPAPFSGLLATPPPRGYDFALETTTPEYTEFKGKNTEYPDNSFNPNENDDYPLTSRDPEFQPVPVGRNPQKPAQPSTPSSPTEDSAHAHTYNNNEDSPLTSEPSHSIEPAGRQYAPPPCPSEAVNSESHPEEQQTQAPLKVVDDHPPPRTDPHLSPGGHVVSVDEDDVDFDMGVAERVQPVATISPSVLNVQQGQRADFHCTVTGNPTPVIQWIGGPRNRMSPRAIIQGGLLTFTSVDVSDEGEYICKALNTHGEHTARVSLFVQQSCPSGLCTQPQVQVSPEIAEVHEGDTLWLYCRASGSPTPKLSWLRNEGQIPPQAIPSHGFHQFESNNLDVLRRRIEELQASMDRTDIGTLLIPNVKMSDSGIYMCIGSNSVGSNSAPIKLTVLKGSH